MSVEFILQEPKDKPIEKDCDNCKHSYEEEDRYGYWRLYCLKKWDNKEGSLVFPYDCCDKFECT